MTPSRGQGQDDEYDPLTIPIGVLGKPHGIHGEIILRPFNPQGAALQDAPAFILEREGGREVRPVRAIRPSADGYLVTFQDVETREQAAALTRSRVRIERRLLPPLADAEYYVEDVVGCRVVNGDDTPLGTVKETFWSGAHDVMVVVGTEEHLIPLIPRFVIAVDAAGRTVRVAWDV